MRMGGWGGQEDGEDRRTGRTGGRGGQEDGEDRRTGRTGGWEDGGQEDREMREGEERECWIRAELIPFPFLEGAK
jgi:hypothetical protein